VQNRANPSGLYDACVGFKPQRKRCLLFWASTAFLSGSRAKGWFLSGGYAADERRLKGGRLLHWPTTPPKTPNVTGFPSPVVNGQSTLVHYRRLLRVLARPGSRSEPQADLAGRLRFLVIPQANPPPRYRATGSSSPTREVSMLVMSMPKPRSSSSPSTSPSILPMPKSPPPF
jgi:hypothetical protein